MKGKVHYVQHINLLGHIQYGMALICEDIFMQGYTEQNFDQISFLSGFAYEQVGEKKIKTATYYFDTANPTDRRIITTLGLILNGHPSIEHDRDKLKARLHEESVTRMGWPTACG